MPIDPSLLAPVAGPAPFNFDKLNALLDAGKQYKTTQAVGQAAAAGDYSGASKAAFAGGDLAGGASMANFGAQQQVAQLQQGARAVIAASRDRKTWDQYAQTHPELGPWENRDQVVKSMVLAASDPSKALEQQNSDRTYQLQQRQLQDTEANAAFDRTAKPSIQKITNVDGSESLVRIMPDGTTTPIYGGNGTGTNPYSVGKMTPEQGKVGTYVDRMAAADKVLANPDVANVNTGVGGAIGAAAENILPAGLVGPLSSNARQMSMQAKRDFLNAVLRRESGAAISSGEFASGNQQYFPQPNDSAEVLAQKAANRKNEIAGFMREAGPNYKPPEGYGGPGKAPGDVSPSPQSNTSVAGGAGTPTANAATAPVKLGPNGEGYDTVKVGGQYIAPDGSVRTRAR